MSDDQEDPMVCYCVGVRKSVIVDAVKNGARDVKDVRKATFACTGCSSCYVDIEQIIDEYEAENPSNATDDTKASE